MESDNPLWGTAIILLLILVMAIISSMKYALEYAGENNIRKKADGGNKKAIALLKFIGSDSKYQSTLNMLLISITVITGIYFIRELLPSFGLNDEGVLHTFYIILSIALLIFLMTLFGLVLPKKLAIRHSEKLSFDFYGLIRFILLLFAPLSYLLEISMNLILRILRINPKEILVNEIEEEIISMVNEGHEQGVFDAGKAEMISNIIGLDDKEVEDIMTHKKRIIAVDSELSVEEALQFMLSENYSRYPLYEDNLDNIVGILHLKDVSSAYISVDGNTIALKEIAREPFFVPDTQSVNLLFHEMQTKNIHMAIVIDEYGQTAGLVAMEDFLEEIVGNIQDEYDEEEKMIISVDNDSYVVKGSISLEDLEDELNIMIDHEDFDTLNGLLISILDRIPADGEKATLHYAGYQFDILETMNKMIGQVRISKLPISMEDTLDGA
ncbi:MAG: HlyC/CorC family transporter [Clostridiales bacterium]|jgi:putative hemolysin|nr:HlyC/CorC family transporter [Clostridiales bacterium]